VAVTVAAAGTATNVGIDDLVSDLNAALNAAGLSDRITAQKVFIATGERISLTGLYDMTITVSYADGNAASEFGFTNGQTNEGKALEYAFSVDYLRDRIADAINRG